MLCLGTKAFGSGGTGFSIRTTIMAIVGGTASALGGGKFSNGAISGAFVHMFNAEAKAFLMRHRLSTKEIMARDKAGRQAYNKQRLKNMSNFMNTHHAGDGSLTFLWILAIPIVGPVALELGLFAETAVISYPVETAIGVGVVDNLFMGGTHPGTVKELGAAISNPGVVK